MKYIETKYKRLYINPEDGEFYSDYIVGKMTKKKSKLKNGCKVINYNNDGSKTYVNVRREVAMALVPNSDNCKLVVTIDGDPMNSTPGNLKWSNVSNMDYKVFAEKKRGTTYKRKSWVGKVVGDFSIVEDIEDTCKLSCSKCSDSIIVSRSKVRGKSRCRNCIDKSLDISSLYSAAFKNWTVLKEDETEDLSTKYKKLIIQCKCCNQTESIKYAQYKDKNRGEYKCNISKEKRRLLLTKYYNMKQRCYNPDNKSYVNYGARGIDICSKWLEDSQEFVKWGLDNGYEMGLEIDREDNNKGYNPENCRWVTKEINNQNQSTTLLSEDLVSIIKNTDWKGKDSRQIADDLGFNTERVKYGRAIREVIKGNTWKNIS